VLDGAFQVHSLPDLSLVTTIPAQYAADFAFLESNTEALVGTWQGGTIQPLSMLN
jgi:hypothetical protein